MLTQEMINALPTSNWNRADYDAHNALNQSLAKMLLISPGHFKQALDAPHKDSPALRIGSLTHMLVLQPELFTTSVICTPEDAPKKPTQKQREAKKPKAETLEAIAWWDNFEQASQGKMVVALDEYQEAVLAGQALKAEMAHWGITPIATELSLVCDYGKVPLKGQLDMVTADGWIYDLKTFGDYISPRNVLSTTYKRAYHLQSAWYCLLFKQVFGFRPKGFRMICVEKAQPNATAIFEISADLQAEGGVLMTQAIEAYAATMEFNSFPCYPKEIQQLKPWKSSGQSESTISFA
jgi:hypothetical protein